MADKTAPPLSLRKLGRIARKLHLSDNCLLLVKAGSELARQDNINDLSTVVERTNLKNVIVIVVDDFDDLLTLDEKKMSSKGWFHINTLSKIIKVPQDKQDADQDKTS